LIAYLARYMPLSQRSVSGVLLSISKELEEASRACGIGYFRTLRKVTIPLVRPGLNAAWLLLFVLFLRELPISILISQSGSEVMSVALLQLLEHATSGETASYALIQSAMILSIVVVFQYVTRSKSPG
jgi:iron(III) transport system permease protein